MMIEYTTQGALRGAKPPASTEQANTASREIMIREAAYFRAEHRAFAPGGELEDWFAAEREIDAVLAPRLRGAGAAAGR
jgi:hypothetical protein